MFGCQSPPTFFSTPVVSRRVCEHGRKAETTRGDLSFSRHKQKGAQGTAKSQTEHLVVGLTVRFFVVWKLAQPRAGAKVIVTGAVSVTHRKEGREEKATSVEKNIVVEKTL